jgi:hypothetical protein
MFFRIQSSCPDKDLLIYRAKSKARLQLATHAFGPSELLLSRYLQENYNMSLRQACLAILQNTSYSKNLKQELIVTIPDPTLNTIAKIITYGTGRIAGSRILKDMLNLS